MDLEFLNAWFGDFGASLVVGAAVGLLFGACAQRSSFCLRAATIEFWRGDAGSRFAIWLFVFASALFGTQWLIGASMLDTEQVRQLTSPGTMSGAIIGGGLFGVGMILARGCASRLLVLSATGNLRALMAGLMLTVVAQASLTGILSPWREAAANWWLIDAETRNLAYWLPENAGMFTAAILLVLAVVIAFRSRLGPIAIAASIGVGLSVTGGWWLTQTVAEQSFEIIPVQSVTFTGPSADTLMALINTSDIVPSFSLGLVPGVFAGSAIMALATGTWKLQGFDGDIGVQRYIAGAVLMGFGGMLAGGCAVGAGITGGSVMALTAWIALLAMWFSAGITDYLLDARRNQQAIDSAAKDEMPGQISIHMPG